MTLVKDIEYVAKLLYDAYRIPVLYEDALGDVVINHGFQVLKNPVYTTVEVFINNVIREDDTFHCPLLKVTDFLENVLLLHVGEQGRRTGTLIVGPTLATDISEEVISGLLLDQWVPSHFYGTMWTYYKQLARVSLAEWLCIGQLACFLLFREKIDKLTLVEHKDFTLKLKNIVDESLQHRRLTAGFHMSYRHEQLIWQCIKEGDNDKLAELLSRFKFEGVGILSKKSQIRHIKNQAVVSVALATRAAIEGGLYPEIAYTMSDIYIQQIEDTKEAHSVYSYMNKYLHDLTDRVHANKQNAHTRSVAICKNYIFDHIFEPISAHELAQLVGLHPVYLSNLFKKETGLSLGQYIQREKIREAKKMLIQSNLTIAEISAMLQFNEQSYFTSVFKKIVGVTPNQYRKKNTGSPVQQSSFD